MTELALSIILHHIIHTHKTPDMSKQLAAHLALLKCGLVHLNAKSDYLHWSSPVASSDL